MFYIAIYGKNNEEVESIAYRQSCLQLELWGEKKLNRREKDAPVSSADKCQCPIGPKASENEYKY